ncbi:MAG: hypothetical protein ACYTBP_16845 [Planctomycetota bacterium]
MKEAIDIKCVVNNQDIEDTVGCRFQRPIDVQCDETKDGPQPDFVSTKNTNRRLSEEVR